jgi:hypothetical protein
MVESLTGLAKCALLFADKWNYFTNFRVINEQNGWTLNSSKNGLNIYLKKETTGLNSLLAWKIM